MPVGRRLENRSIQGPWPALSFHGERGQEPGRIERFIGADHIHGFRRHHADCRAGVRYQELTFENANGLVDGEASLQHGEVGRRRQNPAALDAAKDDMGEAIGDNLDLVGKPARARC